jgi:hypothetical protein
MSTAPLTTATAPEPTSHQQDVLNDLVDLGHELARLVVEQAKARILPADKASIAFDRITRNIRRCVWLERYLARPVKTIDRTAARKRIIRNVEDAIQRDAEDPDEAESLYEELRERLDTPDLEDEIHGRTTEDIITDILRDLGLAHISGSHPWKRRTPADVADLCIRAAQQITVAGLATTVLPVPAHDPVMQPSQTQRPPAGCNSC